MQPSNSPGGGASAAGSAYPPEVRLRKRSEFLRLKDAACKYSVRGLLLVWSENSADHARLGVTVSKKVGCAVTRNRIKRLVREIFRHNRSLLPAVDVNVIARSESAAMDHHTLQQELLKAFRRIGTSQCSKVSHS